MIAKARGNVNIAFIKYWGKSDLKLNLPLTSSIGLTLDSFYTETEVSYHKDLKEDVLYIDNKLIKGNEAKRVKDFMDHIRKTYNIPYYATIKSTNFVPKKAGLSSSSSAFSALSLAATKAYNLNLSSDELSRLARIGSGSASRSVIGNFSIWESGNDLSSYAKEFYNLEDIVLLITLVSKEEKKVSSREAMIKLNDFPKLKKKWINKTNKYIIKITKEFINKDYYKVGLIAEKHALLMHKVINKTGINYLTDLSKEIINLTKNLRKKGFLVFNTIDAGPNVKIITNKETAKLVLPLYQNVVETILSKPGGGVSLID